MITLQVLPLRTASVCSILYLHSGYRVAVVLLAKGLHHGHMTTHSCLCQHTMTAHLYITEIAHDVMRLRLEHAPLTVLHEFTLAVLHTYVRTPGTGGRDRIPQSPQTVASSTCMNQPLYAQQ